MNTSVVHANSTESRTACGLLYQSARASVPLPQFQNGGYHTRRCKRCMKLTFTPVGTQQVTVGVR